MISPICVTGNGEFIIFVFVMASQDNVAGVRLPIFKQVADQEAEEVCTKTMY